MKTSVTKRILSILLAMLMACGAIPLLSVPSLAASTHTLNSHTYDGRYLQVTLTQTKDPTNRRSKITGTVKSLGGNSTWYMTGPTTVKVAGTQRYSRALETSGNGQSNKNFTGTIPEFYVSHDTAGNASVSVEITTSIYYYASQTKSNSWTLDSIGPATLTVTFNANGGSVPTNSATVNAGSATTLPTPTRTGYATFNGWYTASSGGTRVGGGGSSYTPTSSITLYAQWAANTYSVSYNSNKPSTASTAISGTMANSTHTYDTEKNLTANSFTLPGYNFQGWATSASGAVVYSNSASVKNLTSTQGATYTLYAKWNANTYSVKYNSNKPAATNSVISGTMADSSHVFDTAKNLSANAYSLPGYTFQGWATSASGSVVYANSASVINLTTTNNGTYNLYAIWKANTFTVTYNANGGTGSMENSVFTYDQSAFLSENIFERYGYYFMGWAKTSTASAAAYSDWAEVTNLATSGTVPLYAVWSASPVWSITFNLDGGTGGPSGTTIPQSNPVYTVSSIEPARSGYTFTGWALQKSEPNQINIYRHGKKVGNTDYDKITISRNTTLYAQWDKNNYSVKYEKNASDAVDSMANSAHKYDEEKALNSNLYSRPGYIFLGWAVSSNGPVAYRDRENVRNLTPVSNATVILYAVWEPISYSVSFDPNEGEDTMLNQGFKYDEQKPLSACAFQRVGYDFLGWATAPAGSVVYADKANVKNISNIDGDVVLLYARWSPRNDIEYKVEHYLQNADGSYNSIAAPIETFRNGAADQIKTISPTNFEGYTYGATDVSGTELSSAIAPNGSTIYRLYYERNHYSLTVDMDNGSPVIVRELVWGAENELDEPSKQGYAFAGWTKVSGNGENISGNAVTLGKSDLMVKALWATTKNVYTIEFYYEDANGDFILSETRLYDDCVTDETKRIIAPAEDYYIFDSANPLNIVELPIAADGTTVFALYYKRIIVDLHVNPDNGEAPWTTTARWGSSISLVAPSKQGYEFADWDIVSGDAVSGGSKIRLGKTNSSVKAQWAGTANTYRIAYYYEDENGVFRLDRTVTKTDGVTDAYLTITPTPQSSDFMWFDAGNPSNVLAQTISANGDTLYKLYYKRNTFTLTVNANASSADPVEYTNLRWGSKVTLSPESTLLGYRFSGWTVSGTGASVNGNVVTIGTANTFATANWTPRTDIAYRIETYLQNANGTYPTSPSKSESQNDGITDADKNISAPNIERYVFDSGVAGSTGLKLKISADGSTVFKLYYARRTFRLTINKNGGTGGTDTQTNLRWDQSVTLVPPTTPPLGKQFDNWEATPAVSITSNVFTMPYNDIAVTALWAAKTYQISYNANDGMNAPGPQTKTHGIALQLSKTEPTRAGYIFNGWAETAGATQAAYLPDDAFTKDADTPLYAVWSRRGLVASEIYSFTNHQTNFGEKYAVLPSDFNKLSDYVVALYGDFGSWQVIDNLQANRITKWQGSCYGMAATTMLDKTNQIGMNENFAPGAASMSAIGLPKNNPAVESAINYYAISQNIPYLRTAKHDKGTNDFADNMQKVVSDAKAGKNIFFCYFFPKDGKEYGHAIVILGYKGSVNGVHSLLAYDNRDPLNDTLITVSADYASCTVHAASGVENVSGFEATSDMSKFDAIDIDGPANNFVLAKGSNANGANTTEIRFQATGDDLTITNASGQKLIYSASTGRVSGTMQVLNSSFIVNTTSTGASAPVTFVYNVADSNQFRFDAMQPGLDVAVIGGGLYASAAASGAEQATIGANKGVSVEGDGLYDCVLGLGVNNGKCELLQMNATADNAASLQFAGEKVIATADYSRAGSLTLCSNIVDVNTKALASTTAPYYEISWAADGTPIIKAAHVAPSINLGSNFTLYRKNDPGFAAKDTAGIDWVSSNPKILAIDNNGRVTFGFAKIGKVTITAIDAVTKQPIDSVEVNVTWQWWQWILVVLLFGWLYL